MSEKPEIIKIELNNEPQKDTNTVSTRVSFSVLGDQQITPEELIERGGGSGILSVCRKF